MAADVHNFRVKFENGEVEIWGWPEYELRGDHVARRLAREHETKTAKLWKRKPRKIASIKRYHG